MLCTKQTIMNIYNNTSFKIFAAIVFLFLTTNCFSQTTPVENVVKHKDSCSTFGIKFSGFVRNDAYFDTRQVVSARPAVQGDLLLYPSPVLPDVNGKDINATPSFSMMAVTSRLSGAITGPDAFGAKTCGLLEAEFFGNTNGNENIFRLRHAYVKLDWGKTQLLFGQYNHPFYLPECSPAVLSFNAGMPFQPFARNPQIRVTENLSKSISVIVVASSQVESFVSPGSSTGVALGSSVAAASFIDDAVLPDMDVQIQYKKGMLFAGATFDYKEIRPALSQPGALINTVVATTETVKGFSYDIFAKLATKPVLIKAEYVAGQNLYEQLMLGGYLAYTSGSPANITYKPLNVSSAWLDICGTGKKIVPGIFVGYTKNNGADDAGAVATYARGITIGKTSLDKIWRVTPRIDFFSGKFRIGAEVEYTNATYGIAGTNGKVAGTTNDVANVRVLCLTSFSF